MVNYIKILFITIAFPVSCSQTNQVVPSLAVKVIYHGQALYPADVFIKYSTLQDSVFNDLSFDQNKPVDATLLYLHRPRLQLHSD